MIRRPKISTVHPFNYSELTQGKNFAFILNDIPCVVISDSEKDSKMCTGFSIQTYKDGIEKNGKFSMPKSLIDTESIITDVNGLICGWLATIGESEMIQEIDPISNKPIIKDDGKRKPSIMING